MTNLKNQLGILKQTIGNKKANSVDARDLWKFLGSKQEFATWIKKKVISNPWIKENIDWIVFDKIIKNSTGRPQKNYAIVFDLAEKIAMMENTDKGEEIRNYFLGCEKKAKKAHKNLNNHEKIKQIRATMRRLSGCLSKLEKHKFTNKIRVLEGLDLLNFEPPKLKIASSIQEIATNMGILLQPNNLTAVRLKAMNEFRSLYYPKQRLKMRSLSLNGFVIEEPEFPIKDISWVQDFISKQFKIQNQQLKVI